MNKHIQNLKTLRARGLTQNQIAERIGVTQATVSRIMSGELADPRASTADAITALVEELARDDPAEPQAA